MKKAAVIALRVLVSVLLLWLLFRDHAFTREVLPRWWDLAKRWPWGLAGLGFTGLSLLASALRWWLLLRVTFPKPSPGLLLAGRITLEALFFNVCSIGALGGDAYRIIALGRTRPETKLATSASVLLDHTAGLLGMMLIFSVVGVAAVQNWSAQAEGTAGLMLSCAITLLVAGLLMGLAFFSLSPWFVSRFKRFTPPVLIGFVERSSAALAPAWRSKTVMVIAVLCSVVVMLAHFLAFYCAVRALDAQVALVPLMLAMPAVDAAAALPVSISGLGVREKTFEALMHRFTGLAAGLCVAASLVGWFMSVVWAMLGGWLFIMGRSAKLAKTEAKGQRATL